MDVSWRIIPSIGKDEKENIEWSWEEWSLAHG
jgi:hypothetical protein